MAEQHSEGAGDNAASGDVPSASSDRIQPVDPREGLWDPERKKDERAANPPVVGASQPVRRKRALPKSRVSLTLWSMITLVLIVALIGSLWP
ncbi:hypothetical protein [Corynebacterium accolens]|uniref:hypothetical protein n=1 Tax=Corynebacterium accolens TaxID=38284 RepID=UPI002549D735|nr:hypothetical protein [Corynebacterium accolens]MDK8591914.1 hypothetical protein [Corynebacterium accolens]